MSKKNQINFYADDDVVEYVSSLSPGTKGPTLNRIIRKHFQEMKRKTPSELESFRSYLEMHEQSPLATGLATLIHDYYQTMHDAYIEGLNSRGERVAPEHNPCEFCDGDE